MIVSNLEVSKAAKVIGQGGVVAYPTETYYGLGVDPFNPKALARLFQLKKRPEAKPVLTLISHLKQLALLTAEIPSLYLPLCNIWPAPLTLIFPALPSLPALLTGGTGTVAVRMSPHPLAAALVQSCRHPVTATSANISGETPATTPDEVRLHFGNHIDYVMEGGQTCGGLPSTVVGIEKNTLVLIREGVMPFEEIRKTASLHLSGKE